MEKQAKSPKGLTKKKVIVSLAVAVTAAIVFVGVSFGINKVRYYNDMASQANIVQTRELIILAVRGVKKDAPVEPRTGDIYFPESKLYLPNPGLALPLTYLFDAGNVTDSQSELSVSTYPVRGTEKLYTARNVDELFQAVPKLQACSRGVKLVHKKFPQSDTQNELKRTVRLSNGQNLYVYIEKDCPELSETADLFKNIRAY